MHRTVGGSVNDSARAIYTLSALGRQLYSINAIHARRFSVRSRPEAFYRPEDLAKIAATNTSNRHEVPHLINVRLHAIPPSKDGRHGTPLNPVYQQTTSLYGSEPMSLYDAPSTKGPSPISLSWDDKPVETLPRPLVEPLEGPHSTSHRKSSEQRLIRTHDPLYWSSSSGQNEPQTTGRDQAPHFSSPALPADSATIDTTATLPPQNLYESDESATVLGSEESDKDAIGLLNKETHEEAVQAKKLPPSSRKKVRKQSPSDDLETLELRNKPSKARALEARIADVDESNVLQKRLEKDVEGEPAITKPVDKPDPKDDTIEIPESLDPRPWWRRRVEKVAARKEKRIQAHQLNRERADRRRRERLRAVGLLPPLETPTWEMKSLEQIFARRAAKKRQAIEDAHKLEPVVNSEAELETELVSDIQVEPILDADSECWSAPKHAVKLEPIPDANSEHRFETKHEIEVKPVPDAASKNKVEFKHEIEAKPITVAISKHSPKPEPKIQPKDEARLERIAESKHDDEAEVDLQLETEDKAERKLESNAEDQANPKRQIEVEEKIKPEHEVEPGYMAKFEQQFKLKQATKSKRQVGPEHQDSSQFLSQSKHRRRSEQGTEPKHTPQLHLVTAPKRKTKPKQEFKPPGKNEDLAPPVQTGKLQKGDNWRQAGTGEKVKILSRYKAQFEEDDVQDEDDFSLPQAKDLRNRIL